jgi:hypothetical protein
MKQRRIEKRKFATANSNLSIEEMFEKDPKMCRRSTVRKVMKRGPPTVRVRIEAARQGRRAVNSATSLKLLELFNPKVVNLGLTKVPDTLRPHVDFLDEKLGRFPYVLDACGDYVPGSNLESMSGDKVRRYVKVRFPPTGHAKQIVVSGDELIKMLGFLLYRPADRFVIKAMCQSSPNSGVVCRYNKFERLFSVDMFTRHPYYSDSGLGRYFEFDYIGKEVEIDFYILQARGRFKEVVYASLLCRYPKFSIIDWIDLVKAKQETNSSVSFDINVSEIVFFVDPKVRIALMDSKWTRTTTVGEHNENTSAVQRGFRVGRAAGKVLKGANVGVGDLKEWDSDSLYHSMTGSIFDGFAYRTGTATLFRYGRRSVHWRYPGEREIAEDWLVYVLVNTVPQRMAFTFDRVSVSYSAALENTVVENYLKLADLVDNDTIMIQYNAGEIDERYDEVADYKPDLDLVSVGHD